MNIAGSDLETYIRQAAQMRGIDPDRAMRVVMNEGGVSDPVRQSDYRKNGVREPSFGPFQLLVGGEGTGFPRGLGNRMIEETGLDPRDPSNVYAGIDYALDEVVRDGWRQWYGAAKAGVGRWDGVGQGAQALGVSGGVQLPSEGPVPSTPESAAAAYAPVSQHAGLMAIENLLNAAQPDSEMPVPSLRGFADVASASNPTPTIQPAPALTQVAGNETDMNEAVQKMLQGMDRFAPKDDAGLLSLEQIIDGSQTENGIRAVTMGAPMQGPPMPTPDQTPAARAGAAIGAMAGRPPVQGPAPAPQPAQPEPAADFDTLGLLDKPFLSPAAGLPFVDQTPLPTLAMQDITTLPGGGLNPGAPVIGDLGKLNTFTAQPMPQPVQQGPAPIEQGDTAGGFGGPAAPVPGNRGFAPLPDGPNAPTPTAKPAKTPFDTIGFLGALGSVMAALDQGSPDLSSVSLPGVLHKPGAFQGLPMPKGLL